MCDHNYRFIDDNFTVDRDGWIRGPARCTRCGGDYYLYFYPGPRRNGVPLFPEPFHDGIVIIRGKQPEGRTDNAS